MEAYVNCLRHKYKMLVRERDMQTHHKLAKLLINISELSLFFCLKLSADFSSDVIMHAMEATSSTMVKFIEISEK